MDISHVFEEFYLFSLFLNLSFFTQLYAKHRKIFGALRPLQPYFAKFRVSY